MQKTVMIFVILKLIFWCLGNMIIIYSNVTHKTGPCPQAPVNWWLSKQRKAAPPRQDILAGGTFMSFELTNNIWFYESRVDPHQLSALTDSQGASQAFVQRVLQAIETWQGHLAAFTEQADKMLKCSKQKVQQTTKQCGHLCIFLPLILVRGGDLILPTGRSVLRIWLR